MADPPDGKLTAEEEKAIERKTRLIHRRPHSSLAQRSAELNKVPRVEQAPPAAAAPVAPVINVPSLALDSDDALPPDDDANPAMTVDFGEPPAPPTLSLPREEIAYAALDHDDALQEPDKREVPPERNVGEDLEPLDAAQEFDASNVYLANASPIQPLAVDQLPGFDDAYRTHQPQAEPLNWNTPIGKEQSLTLGDFLHSLLDQHINGNLCAGNVEWLLSLVRELLGKYGDTNVPVSRQEYTRLIDLLKDNARFYLTCASHCCPCAAQTQECPVCKGPLFKDNKPAGLFFVRDPREWVKRLRQVPVLAKALTYPIMRLKDCAPDASLEDVWDGELFTWLMAPNAEPLFRPRPDPLPVSFPVPSAAVAKEKLHTARDVRLHAEKWRTQTAQYRVKHDRSARAHIDLKANDIAMMLVADGFSVFDRGEKSAWTANLAILNFPPELRFRAELMFALFGFSGSPAASLEPFLRLALIPFVESLDADTRIVLALLGGDEAAIKKIIGAMQHGSLIGCECCHGAGEIPDGRKTACYPRSAEAHSTRLTMEDYCAAVDALNVRDASTAQRDGVAKFLGWKFVTCLTQLPYFNVIDSVVEDFLHRLSLGVCASLVAATFGYKNRKVSTLQLPATVATAVSVRVCVLSAQLPRELHTRLPAPLGSWPWYTGAQFVILTRIMPICLALPVTTIPAVKDVPKVAIAENLRKLMQLWSLLRDLVIDCSAVRTDKDRRSRIAKNALALMDTWENYLGRTACTYNVHKLCHLCQGICLHGPMCRYWAYPFERLNLESTEAVHRRDAICIQLANAAARKEIVALHYLSERLLKARSLVLPVSPQIAKLQQVALACESGVYQAPARKLYDETAKWRVTPDITAEVAEFVSRHYPLVEAPQVVTKVALYKLYAKCSLAYKELRTWSYSHKDPRLATTASRGAVVCVECTQEGTSSRWFGVIRFFAHIAPYAQPACDVAYVDYFARTEEGKASPVKAEAYPDKSANAGRVVLVEDIVCRVMLMPAQTKCHWFVVDGIDGED